MSREIAANLSPTHRTRYSWSPDAADALGRSNHTWIDTATVPRDRPYPFVDLFCGCGGLTTGCVAAGLRPVLAVEHWAPAASTHRLNHPGVWLYDRDVTTLSENRLLSGLGDERPDVIVGGPPCTKFSPAGDQDTGHPVARLYLQYLRIVAALRPHVCVIENVPGLLQMKCRHVLDDIIIRLSDLDYVASVLVLNAAWCGVPQTRERVIIIANRHGLPNPYPQPLLPDENGFVTTRDVLLDLSDLPRDLDWSHDWPVHGPEMTVELGAVRPGGRRRQHRQGYRRLRPDRPAWTVTDNHGCSFTHPWLPRIVSPREMARLQAFPDGYHFRGSLMDQMHQIGNAVPVPLARHIALAVRTLLDQVV